MTATFATTTVLTCIALGIVFVKWRAAVDELAHADQHAQHGWTAARAHERAANMWRTRALDAELGVGLLGNELERVEAQHVDELAAARTRKAAAKPTPIRKRAAKGVKSS